jgi:hypothetical protein
MISLGVGNEPPPGAADNGRQITELGVPAELAAGFVGTGHQDGRIALPAGRDGHLNRAIADAAGGLDNLEDGVAVAVAQIEGPTAEAVDIDDGLEVSLGNIEDVDVIPDTSAVGGGIVIPKNGDGGAGKSGFKDVGDEVGFGPMVLAQPVTGAGGIEIP